MGIQIVAKSVLAILAFVVLVSLWDFITTNRGELFALAGWGFVFIIIAFVIVGIATAISNAFAGRRK